MSSCPHGAMGWCAECQAKYGPLPCAHDFRLGPCQWDRVGPQDGVAWDSICLRCGGALMFTEKPEGIPDYSEADWSPELEAKLHRLDDRDPLHPWDRLVARG